MSIPSAMAVRLVRHWRIIRDADVVVVMAEGGFGHTVAGPDLARRMFRGQACVFVILGMRSEYNPEIRAIWPDIRVLFVPCGGRSVWPVRVRAACGRIAWWLLRGMVSAGVPVLGLLDLYREASDRDPLTVRGAPLNWRWPLAYFRLQARVPASRVGLPDAARVAIERELDAAARSVPGWRRAKRCCLYLRGKGRGSSDLTNAARVGSPLESYVGAIGVLVSAGYQVLLTGEAELNRSLVEEFGGALVDAPTLGVDRDLFSIYAATETDIAIAESGGGVWLPGVNGIPRLLVNAFPYFFGMPNACVYYKTVRDATGRLVDYRRLFADHAFDYELRGWSLTSNSSWELREAVVDFLGGSPVRTSEATASDGVTTFPEHVWLRYTNGRLSGAWLRLYGEEDAGRPVSRSPGSTPMQQAR